MQQLTINDIEEYLTLIKQYKSYSARKGQEELLFRGQKLDHPLLPKICRLFPRADLLATESAILQEFKRTNLLLLDYQRPMDDWDYLTLGQHYGLPTRLLDWSNNSLTALWFATEQADLYYANIDSVVWILAALTNDFELAPEQCHPFDVADIMLFRPRIIKQRINNQSGVFSICSSEQLKNRTEITKSENFNDRLLKVVIPAKAQMGIRQDLDSLGVNAFTIFPELEGLCTYLQWKYFELNPSPSRQPKS
jgi:hypothetical protein